MKMSVTKIFILFCLTLILWGCVAGPNPNPGERSADMLWEKYRHEEALEIIIPAAEKGYPWAQLRLGVAYELGKGVPADIPKALYWYKKASVHKGNDKWSEGTLVGSVGPAHYFNQNSDAMVAQYQIANIYLHGKGVKKDLVAAYLWAKYVVNESAGENVFYCCEFEGGRWILQKDIQSTLSQIVGEMSSEEKAKAKQLLPSWKPSV